MAANEVERVFLRGISSADYGLKGFRERQLTAARVRDDSFKPDPGTIREDDGRSSRAWWRVSPGDDPFITQTLQMHFSELPPGLESRGHGHQNEAAFFVLEGRGYEIHDDQRYDWEAGDLVLVHVDSVHRHFNPYGEKAKSLVIKAKGAWMYLGLLQQGRIGAEADEVGYGPRLDWSPVWTPGVTERRKVVKPADTIWQDTPLGRVRVLAGPGTDARTFSVDIFQLEVPAGGSSGRRWQMADELLYVLDGSGYSLHWRVECDIADRYYARIAEEPQRYDFKTGDSLYVPQNTVAQHFSADGKPLLLLSGQNRIFKMLGYDSVAYLDENDQVVATESAGA